MSGLLISIFGEPGAQIVAGIGTGIFAIAIVVAILLTIWQDKKEKRAMIDKK